MSENEKRIDADPATGSDHVLPEVQNTVIAEGWKDNVPVNLFRPVLVGSIAIATFLLGFGIWAVSAPLSGAAIASGHIMASGQNQAIQHLEGGIIREIPVKSGDLVKQGQPLVYLQTTQAEADRNRIEKSMVALRALIARARAELAGQAELDFGDELAERAIVTNNEESLDQQRSEFLSKLARHQSELGALDDRIQAVEEEISGIELQISAEKTKLELVTEEAADKKTLLDQGLTPKSQYSQLLRAKAEIQGNIGSLSATIGQRRSAIAELREQQATLEAARKAQASAELNDTSPRLEDLREQLNSRADILERMIIRAPVDGVIVKLDKNTIGGIVSPSETLMEILPTSSELIVSARVRPQDIDIVKVGQEASIRFLALNSRTTPEAEANVEYVSADRLIDPATQEPYYDARLKLASNLPKSIESDQIYPGMPVEAFIKSGERTFLEYLVQPINDSFNKAFREE